MSLAIQHLVSLARKKGLTSTDGAWSEAFVYWFDATMPDEVRLAGQENLALDYFSSDQTPHNPADEGFIDRPARTAVSFLLESR